MEAHAALALTNGYTYPMTAHFWASVERQWANNEPSLGQYVVFSGKHGNRPGIAFYASLPSF